MESWTNPVRDACDGPAVTRKQMAEVLVGIVGIAIAGFILLRVVQAVALGGHPKPAINRHLKTGN